MHTLVAIIVVFSVCGVVVDFLFTCLRPVLREIWGAVTNDSSSIYSKTREDSEMTIVTVFISATMTVARKGLSYLLR